MKNNPIKNLILFVIIILIFTGAYILLNRLTQEKNEIVYLKDYGVNEYITTYVSDEDMAKIYLNDYIYNMYSNIDKAYNSLDEKYRYEKFGSLESYKNYVDSLNYSTYTLSKYYKQEKDGYIIFGVYDQNNNLFIFKTKGVLQYTVYLDDYTIEI